MKKQTEGELASIFYDYEIAMFKIVKMCMDFPHLLDEFKDIHRQVLEREYAKRAGTNPVNR